jgi:hypothetical protein
MSRDKATAEAARGPRKKETKAGALLHVYKQMTRLTEEYGTLHTLVIDACPDEDEEFLVEGAATAVEALKDLRMFLNNFEVAFEYQLGQKNMGLNGLPESTRMPVSKLKNTGKSASNSNRKKEAKTDAT